MEESNGGGRGKEERILEEREERETGEMERDGKMKGEGLTVMNKKA